MNLTPDNLKKLSEKVSVILVEPKYQGNVGAVARLLRNFGLSDLILVNFREVDDEAISRSMEGKQILLNARRFDTFSEAAREFNIVAGTSSIVTGNYKKFRRIPITPPEFWEAASRKSGKIALAFGREVDGLSNEELGFCDYFVHIPANPDFPVLNLSHAVSVILYEMTKRSDLTSTDLVREVNALEAEKLIERIEKLLEKSGYPDYRRENTMVMLRRIIARSSLTDSEFYKLMGVIRSLLHSLDSSELEK